MMFKNLFKKKSETPLENNPITQMVRFSKLKASWPKIKFGLSLLICLSLLIASIIYSYEYVSNAAKKSIKLDQTVMVNVITEEVFIGSLYKNNDKETKDHPADDKPNISDKDTTLNKINKDSPANFRAARLTEDQSKKAKIAVVITGLGLCKDQTQEVLNLENNLTLGFSPYGSDVSEWINQAVGKGFEVLMQLPVQPADYQINDPGPFAILSNLNVEENLSRLNTITHLNNKIIGFYMQANEVLSNNKADFTYLANKLSLDQYMLVYANEQNKNQIQDVCKTSGLECLLCALPMEDETDEIKISQALNKAEVAALSSGQAIVYINNFPTTIKALNKWTKELNTNNIIIVPVSNLLPPFDPARKLLENSEHNLTTNSSVDAATDNQKLSNTP